MAGLVRMDHRGAPMSRILSLILLTALSVNACGVEAPVKIPAPAFDPVWGESTLQTAVVAGGCFWGVQGVYQHLKGVTSVLSGYAGGVASTADYETVSGGDSGHAESVQIVYDPAQVTYGQILQVFFSVAHDPTQLNAQGPDTGTQYRSAIFYTTDAQKKIAEGYIAQLDQAGVFPRKIVTRVDSLKGFYEAEPYHQDYLINHPTSSYIVYNDLPKVRNFQSTLPSLYVAKPVTVSESKRAGEKAVTSAAPTAPAGSGAMMMAAAEKPAEGGAMMSAQGATGQSKTEG